ncbi:uncharacterized protein fest isoform X2 [Halyomorpha halys]|uniref:uncharacterized protein fest isoform X2 n=1 Tax=Halyomorpha halys TaxID=286706 RepID=UPI0006D4DE47|nr:uncharacterized protein LOC106683180 isoform X2 [Halyomorpha halys]
MSKIWRRESFFSKLLDTPLSEPWTTGTFFGNPVSPLCNAAALAAPIWRTTSRTSNKVYPYFNPTPEDTSAFQEMEGDLGLPGTATATAHGTISLRLAHRMRVDLTIDRAVRLLNFKNNIVIAMNPTGSACALLHPNGRVHQYGSRVEIMAHDIRGNHKYAKMWYKGVSFTSENCALVYLVDSAGTRTTTDSFSDLMQDFSLGVFYSESRHGQTFAIDAVNIIHGAQYWTTEEGVENWLINNVRISQAPDGLVRVARNSNKYHLRTSPTNGTASMTTPFLHCTASMGSTSHLFVRRGERRMHFDGSSFIVRNAGHSAGFDEKTQLKVF